jgi:Domain of unknown function (DUF222)
MRSDSGSDREEILAVYDEWEAINDKVAALSLDALTDTELLDLQGRREVVARRQPVVDHQVINRLAAEADPKALGAKNLADVLATRLDTSTAEAKRRIKYAELLGPRQALTGEPLPPRLPHVAGVQARGQIGAEHLRRRAHRHRQTHPGLRSGQPPGRTRLDHPKTHRRPHRMDSAATPKIPAKPG